MVAQTSFLLLLNAEYYVHALHHQHGKEQSLLLIFVKASEILAAYELIMLPE